jgi:opacity protein-like surface antigen
MCIARLKLATLAALATLAVTAAHAADMPLPPPPAEPCCSSWYLRGFVGVGLTHSDQMQYIQNPANAGTDFRIDTSSIGDANFIGGAIGYNFNKWLRFDGSIEYRSKARVDSFGHYTVACTDASLNPEAVCLDTYQGYVKSWVGLANAYVDLGTWWCLTPFVGAGIGGAYNQITNFYDINTTSGGFGFGRNSAEWHMAYALYAGLAYNVSQNLKVDLTYRYLNYGSITDTVDCVGGCNPDQFKFGNLQSHDFMLGLRWTCCDVEQPRTVYAPPPPPPLHSRG